MYRENYRPPRRPRIWVRALSWALLLALFALIGALAAN